MIDVAVLILFLLFKLGHSTNLIEWIIYVYKKYLNLSPRFLTPTNRFPELESTPGEDHGGQHS